MQPSSHLYEKKGEHFKYLGHWVIENLQDSGEHCPYFVICCRAGCERCDGDVKTTHIQVTKHQTFYTCRLWTSCTKMTVKALHVQYNNGFRVLLMLYCRAYDCADKRTDSFITGMFFFYI